MKYPPTPKDALPPVSEQAAAEIGGEARQSGKSLRAHLAGGHVLEDHGAKGKKPGKIVRQRRGGNGLHAELAGRERAAQVVRAPRAIDQQDRGGGFNANGAVAHVVLGHAVIRRAELEAIPCDTGSIDHVAKRQL